MQIEPGPVATPFERRPVGQELALCQRYYLRCDHSAFASLANMTMISQSLFPSTMRATPAATWTPSSFTNVTSFVVDITSTTGFRSVIISDANGAGDWAGTLFFNAEI